MSVGPEDAARAIAHPAMIAPISSRIANPILAIGFLHRFAHGERYDRSDLFVANLKVTLQRAEAKDYRDIAAILGSGEKLSEGWGGAHDYGNQFQPSESLKAMTHFEDGDPAALGAQERELLVYEPTLSP